MRGVQIASRGADERVVAVLVEKINSTLAYERLMLKQKEKVTIT
jgi:hypothetical protein